MSQPSHVSHVSNQEVRKQAGWISLSALLLQRQLLYLGKILRQDPGSLIRKTTFVEGTLQAATSKWIRKVGRPRLEWATAVLPHACRLAGGICHVEAAVQDKLVWKSMVKTLKCYS